MLSMQLPSSTWEHTDGSLCRLGMMCLPSKHMVGLFISLSFGRIVGDTGVHLFFFNSKPVIGMIKDDSTTFLIITQGLISARLVRILGLGPWCIGVILDVP